MSQKRNCLKLFHILKGKNQVHINCLNYLKPNLKGKWIENPSSHYLSTRINQETSIWNILSIANPKKYLKLQLEGFGSQFLYSFTCISMMWLSAWRETVLRGCTLFVVQWKVILNSFSPMWSSGKTVLGVYRSTLSRETMKRDKIVQEMIDDH